MVFLYTAPIFTALALHWRFPEEKLRRAQWVGVMIAFAGIAVTFVGGGVTSGPALSGSSLVGDLLGLLGGVAWALTTLAIRCTRLSGAAPSHTLLYQLLGALILLTPAALLTSGPAPRFTLLACLCLLFQTVVVCFGSYLLWFTLLGRYRTSQLGTLAFMTPPFGVLMGVVILNEPLESHFLVGGALVLGGVLVVTGHQCLGMRGAAVRGA